MLYDAYQKGPFKVKGYHDKDSIRVVGILFKPLVWVQNTVYYRQDSDNYDVVIPSVFTGVYFKVSAPGKSGATEPAWTYTQGDLIEDGTTGLVWEAVNYNLLPFSDSLSTTTFSANYGVTVAGTNTSTTCQFTIDPLPAAAVSAGSFDVTTHYTTSSGEEDDVTLRFKVAER